MRTPLCLNPPSTRRWPAFGVAWRISLTFTSSSSSVMSLKCSPIPTGNPNSCLIRRRRVRSEISRILPMSAQRKPASLCQVWRCFCKTCSLGLPTNPLLVTPTCTRGSLHGGDGGVSCSHSSTVLTKSLVSSFTIEWSSFWSLINSTSLGKDSSILRIKIARVLSFSWRRRTKKSAESYDAVCLCRCALVIKLPREKKNSSTLGSQIRAPCILSVII